ncbi:MAG: hypothetical protein A2275_17900 [Bacteroidetes bacterium RIFOXYA12_FULL_35_11]|nr:MAG: hypothetical protein A2X01_19000 [Bacteroidetes bacterium GWF2_35_48]OFY74894.1 MAG: hypothetical protein A2275_17900 [Bacteroidetes bacterium RIFOXYA12_FULL_35_11]OFY95706.1 MAG: hypothetical protein A2491_08850 [Bacteroidetes bacterium RIFOXYC12_FULL_35_7]HBX49572.1 hypothetical protein [Bacteroidales bacterium]
MHKYLQHKPILRKVNSKYSEYPTTCNHGTVTYYETVSCQLKKITLKDDLVIFFLSCIKF